MPERSEGEGDRSRQRLSFLGFVVQACSLSQCPVTDIALETREASIQRTGRWMIVAGVLVWGVWLIAKLIGGEPELQYFLPLHLLGVIPGSILSRWSALKRWRDT